MLAATPSTTPPSPGALPDLLAQAARLVQSGVHELAGLSAPELCDLGRDLARYASDGRSLLVLSPRSVPVSLLAPLLRSPAGRQGFVVEDLHDVDQFEAVDGLSTPDLPAYVLAGIDRGDHLAGWSPDEALPALLAGGRTPLLLAEGVHWVLQVPAVLERNHCFMTIGSRRRRAGGALDARAPALWISNGTGRDGRERRDAPKVGWCWAGNRHTWLGFASAASRQPVREVSGTV